MPALPLDVPGPTRNPAWKWWICGLLLLATMINYMDRLTLNQTVKRLMDEFHFAEGGFGNLEGWFGAAFAIGGLFGGLMVDQVGVRFVYPVVVFLWSVAGFLTGFA